MLTLLIAALAFAPPTAPAATPPYRPRMAELMPLYSPLNIRLDLHNPGIKAELKITKEQEKAVQAICMRQLEKHPYKTPLDVKGTEQEKAAKLRAIDTADAAELFQALSPTLSAAQIKRLKQIMARFHGCRILEIAEIRAQLKISDKQIAELLAMKKKLRDDVGKEAMAGKLDAAAADKKLMTIDHNVVPQMRALLTAEQQASLDDILGPPFDRWK